MEITDLKIKNKNSIKVKDSLKAPLLRLSVTLDNSTTIPTSNDLIVYVSKNENTEKKEYTFTLSKPLKYLDNVSDEFILSPKLNGNKIDLKAYVIRRIENSLLLDNEVIEEFFYEPIILEEGENLITTNYTDAIIEMVYPKNTEIVNYFLSNSMYKESDNTLTLDDIYFKDAFTKVEEGINADFNRVNLNCFKLKDSPFGLDALGNLTVNSIITVDSPSSDNLNFDKIYPVGSVFINVSDTNPTNLFGGSWERFAKGRTLVGLDEDQTEFSTTLKTGGEKTHNLTINEMPTHRHDNLYGDNGVRRGAGYNTSSQHNGIINEMGQADWESLHTGETGGNSAHNNLQPYITVYMWVRIA